MDQSDWATKTPATFDNKLERREAVGEGKRPARGVNQHLAVSFWFHRAAAASAAAAAAAPASKTTPSMNLSMRWRGTCRKLNAVFVSDGRGKVREKERERESACWRIEEKNGGQTAKLAGVAAACQRRSSWQQYHAFRRPALKTKPGCSLLFPSIDWPGTRSHSCNGSESTADVEMDGCRRKPLELLLLQPLPLFA